MGAGRKICLWFLANCEVQLCSALAAISILSVIVICPLLIDPAIDTLVSSFEEGVCQTIYGRYLTGLSNCTWTSCRAGCTADIFNCTQIVVLYTRRPHAGISHDARSDNPGNRTQAGQRGWALPVRDIDYALVRDWNLTLVLDEFLEGWASEEMRGLSIGALFPNPQGCVYPSEGVCVDFNNSFAAVSGEWFPCFINSRNGSIVTTELDKLGAVANICYSFIPLVSAGGVFTYLFYRVGLIGNKAKSKLKVLDEDVLSSDSDTHKPGLRFDRDGRAINGSLPGIKKKVRKKFLPKRESSKKRRKGKLFNKNRLLSVTQQVSLRSPTSGRRGSFEISPRHLAQEPSTLTQPC